MYLGVVITHMDEFVDSCLREATVLEVDLPLLQKRDVLVKNQILGPRVSILDEDVEIKIG